MTAPNPFAQQPAAAPQQPANPFAQPAPPAPAAPVAPQQPAAANPFAPGVPAQQAPAPVAPQAYAPPQQQFAAGVATYPGAPTPVQHYAPPAPAAPQQGYAAPALDPNALRGAGAPPASYVKGPQLPDMYDRLVLMFPLSIERVERNSKYITDQDRANGNMTQDRMTTTIVILDSGRGTPPGGTIPWGGAPQALPPTPHTNNDPLPYIVKGKWITQTKLIDQCRPFLAHAPGAAPGMVAGRMVKRGPAHNDPWYLESATEADLNLARTYLGLVANGVYPHPLAL
jgi:hypothetical protein